MTPKTQHTFLQNDVQEKLQEHSNVIGRMSESLVDAVKTMVWTKASRMSDIPVLTTPSPHQNCL